MRSVTDCSGKPETFTLTDSLDTSGNPTVSAPAQLPHPHRYRYYAYESADGRDRRR